MNVAQQLAARAVDHPGRLAMIDRSGRVPRMVTFAELDRASREAANAFIASGLKPGARVVVLHPMSAELYIALAGLFYAGLVPVVCDPAAGRTYVKRCIAAVAPDALFASLPGLVYAATIAELARVPRRFSTRPLPGVRSLRTARAGGVNIDIAERSSNEPALITFTSGSTGTPKVVVRTHAILTAQLEALRSTLSHGHIDVATMPIVLLANLACGITSVIPSVRLRRPGAIDADRLAGDIVQTRATSIIASPALLERLTHARDRTALTGLRRIVTGGAPVMPSLLDALHAIANDAAIVALYGSTEAEPIAHLAFEHITDVDRLALRSGAGLLAGDVAEGTSLRIIAGNWGTALDSADAIPAGTVGEIIVAGLHVVPGYLDGTGDAETKIHDGARVWHRTGDLGYLDVAGRLWLMGRAQAAISDRREAAYPFAVEAALSTEPAIERSALIEIDERRVVVVTPRPNMSIDRERLRDELAFARVDEIRVVAHIPVDVRHNAKVDYPALRRQLGIRTSR